MTTPDQVLISQVALNDYATAVDAEASALNEVATSIADAVGVLGPYIAALVAGQSVTYSDADVSALNTALGDLQAASDTVTLSARSVAGLEPPAATTE